jgi:hypothetical protein
LDPRISVESVLGGDKSEGCKIVEAEVTKGADPQSQPVVISKKEPSVVDTTHKLVFLEVLEIGCVGSLNLWVSLKGPVCYFFRVYWRPEELIQIKVFEDP